MFRRSGNDRPPPLPRVVDPSGQTLLLQSLAELERTGRRPLNEDTLGMIVEEASDENGSNSSLSEATAMSVSDDGDEHGGRVQECACWPAGAREGLGALLGPNSRPLRRKRREGEGLAGLPVRVAKRRLLEALREADGEPRDGRVVAAAADLAREARLDPAAAAAAGAESPGSRAAEAASGRWTALTRAEFPGSVSRTPGGDYAYALGRMSFGLFAPGDVIVAVEGCSVGVGPPTDAAVPEALVLKRIRLRAPPVRARDVRTYDVETRFHVVDARGAGLRGVMTTRGHCAPAAKGSHPPDAGHRLDVWFGSGEIAPIPRSRGDRAKWAALFGRDALPPAPLTAKLGRWLAKVAAGIEVKEPEKAGVQRYEASKPNLGHVDVLYSDADLRVTRGNRGTLVVLAREVA